MARNFWNDADVAFLRARYIAAGDRYIVLAAASAPQTQKQEEAHDAT